MTFIAAQSELHHASRDGLLQMKQFGSTEHLNLIAEFDTGTEGPTRRYYLQPISEGLSKNIENARKMFADLDLRDDALVQREDPFTELEDPFRELLKEEKTNAAGIFKKMLGNRFKVVIGGKPKPLKDVFDTILPEPEQRRRFRKTYLSVDSKNRKKLLGRPFWLKPFLFECLFESENKTCERCAKQPVSKVTSTGNPLVLRKFLEWGIKRYRSKYKMVVIKGHGDGFSVAWDATRNNANISGLELDRLRAVELREAFSIPKKDQPACFEFFDIVGFNACSMGMLEVYHKLRHYVRYGIASEGPTPHLSWPFLTILRKLQIKPKMEPDELAKTILNDYIKKNKKFEKDCLKSVKKEGINEGECTIDLSICDLFAVQGVVDHLEKLTAKLRNILEARQRDPLMARKLVAARADSQHYSDGEYVDLSHFCQNLRTKFKPSADVYQLSAKVIDAVDQMTPKEHHRHLKEARNSFGLSIYFPEFNFSPSYARSLQIKEMQWIDFLRAYVEFGTEGTITRAGQHSITVKWDANRKKDVLQVIQTGNARTKITINHSATLSELKPGQKIIIGSGAAREIGLVKRKRMDRQTVTIEKRSGEHKLIRIDKKKLRIIGISSLKHLTGLKVTVKKSDDGTTAEELRVSEVLS